MKKIKLIILLTLIALSLFVSSCNKNIMDEASINIGKYAMEDSKEPVKPIISLEDYNKFTFNYSGLSSYVAVGTYMKQTMVY